MFTSQRNYFHIHNPNLLNGDGRENGLNKYISNGKVRVFASKSLILRRREVTSYRNEGLGSAETDY